MTVGFSLPVKSFSFDIDNAKSENFNHTIHFISLLKEREKNDQVTSIPINGFNATWASMSCLEASGSNCSM